MSMPQHFNVVVLSEGWPHGGEIAGAVTTLLRAPEKGIQPFIVAAATHSKCRLALSAALTSRRLIFSRPVPPQFLNPRAIDLWLVMDERAEKGARWMIKESGPAPRGFYRHIFRDPVQPFGVQISPPPRKQHLDRWLDELRAATRSWRERIWEAFYDSS